MGNDNLIAIAHALDSGSRCFIIRGAAGTGKTTLVKSLFPLLKERGFGIRLMAPTGRAAMILHQRTGIDASTIHSCIFNITDEPLKNEEGDALKWIFPLKEDIDEESEAFIIDEASMVGLAEHDNDRELFQFGTGSLLKDLIQYSGICTRGTSNLLFFVGDPFQLPPVGEKCDSPPALDETKLEELTGFKPTVIELSTVHRQHHLSGILKEATKLRTLLSSRDFNRFSFESHADLMLVESDALQNIFVSEQDMDDKIIIAQTNMRVREYNHEIRRQLNHLHEMPEAGERLLSVRNTQLHLKDGTKMQFLNGDFLRVVSAEDKYYTIEGHYRPRDRKETYSYTYTFQRMTVEWIYEPERAKAESIWVNITPILLDSWDDNVGYASIGLYNGIKDNIEKRLREKHSDYRKDREKKNFWDAEMRKMIQDSSLLHAPIVKFGYAVTGHKAQGGEWNKVWADYSYGANQQSSYYFRWAYTVTTRAKKILYVSCAPRIDALARLLDGEVGASVTNTQNYEMHNGTGSIYDVLTRDGCKVDFSKSIDSYRTRIRISRGEGSFATSGYVDIVNKGNGIISQVDIHFDSFGEPVLNILKAFVGKRKDIALGLERSLRDVPVIVVEEIQKPVVERIMSDIEGTNLQLVSAKAITEHHLRLSFESVNGGGELDLYFNKKGVLTSLGRNTLQKSDFEVLRECI